MNPLERAAHARTLLESSTYKAAHEEIRSGIIHQLESVGVEDIEKQHELVLLLQLHNRHKRTLERWIDDGKVEQKRLDHKNWIERTREYWSG